MSDASAVQPQVGEHVRSGVGGRQQPVGKKVNQKVINKTSLTNQNTSTKKNIPRSWKVFL